MGAHLCILRDFRGQGMHMKPKVPGKKAVGGKVAVVEYPRLLK